jgi:hypothetical protein
VVANPSTEEVPVTRVRVTGFWAETYSDHNPLARSSFDWPSGTIEVRDHELVLDVHPPFGFLNFLLKWSKHPISVVVPLDAITSLRIREGAIGHARVISDDPRFRCLRFGALGRRFDRVIESLREHNVVITQQASYRERSRAVVEALRRASTRQ